MSFIPFSVRFRVVIEGSAKLERTVFSYYKNTQAGKLEIAGDGPGSWQLHSETMAKWARHMCTEYQD
jgi:hypothetical protein